MLRVRCALLLVLAVGTCSRAAESAPPPGWDYDLTMSPDGTRVTVQVCFRGVTPRALKLVRPDALSAVKMHPHPDGTQSYRHGGARGAIVPRLGAHRCVRYDIDLAELKRVARRDPETIVGDGALVLNPGLLLLHPTAWPARASVTARFAAAGGTGFATAWQPLSGSERLVVPRAAMLAGSRMVVGRFTKLTVEAAKCTFRVAVLPGPRLATDEGLRTWVTHAARAVADLYGRFPARHVMIAVVVSRGGHEPVLFGRAMRSGGETLALYLAGNARDPDLPGEWVAVHEMTHLGMPWMPPHEAWISEGFVTYYQEVLRGRSGHHTALEAWQQLHAGFGRGRRSGSGRSLEEESRHMHRSHAYHRVYWGGAALAMAIDVAIRRESGGRRSLDDVIRRWQEVHPPGRSYTGRQLLATADRMLGTRTCSELAERYLRQSAFPTLRREYAALGLGVRDGQIVFLPKAPQAADRTRIMRAGGR